MRRKSFRVLFMTVAWLFSVSLSAQDTLKVCTVKNGQQVVWLSKFISEEDLNAFIRQYALEDLALKRFIQSGFEDSIRIAGWRLGVNNKNQFTLTKPLAALGDLGNTIRFFLGEEDLPFSARFPRIHNGLIYGVNDFRNKPPFSLQADSTIQFFLRGKTKASRVMLAGSFNDWDPNSIPMKKTEAGWVASLKLLPGKYWYKFIIDGQWDIDHDNRVQKNDGMGNTNSVFFVFNHQFQLAGYDRAKKVVVTGSFNGWSTEGISLVKSNGSWQIPLYLAEGTHTYRFIVDGHWMEDPGNPKKYPNEYGEYNSVIQLGKPRLFELSGYPAANKVSLAGSFNKWRSDEVFLSRMNNGWFYPYYLGAGNHQYQYFVDGKPVGQKEVLILEPNYTFRLKGYENARTIFLAGDFNDWAPDMLKMERVDGEWVATVNLSKGKHLYKFIVDGKWILDPDNRLWEDNEEGTGNSVVWRE